MKKNILILIIRYLHRDMLNSVCARALVSLCVCVFVRVCEGVCVFGVTYRQRLYLTIMWLRLYILTDFGPPRRSRSLCVPGRPNKSPKGATGSIRRHVVTIIIPRDSTWPSGCCRSSIVSWGRYSTWCSTSYAAHRRTYRRWWVYKRKLWQCLGSRYCDI